MSKFLKISCTILFVPGILLVSFLWADGGKHEKKRQKSSRSWRKRVVEYYGKIKTFQI